MRLIKFRAWIADSEEMVNISDSNNNYSFTLGEKGFIAEAIEEEYYESGGETHNRDVWSIVEATVMQYTGLKDKNGVEIYEGDILTGYKKGSNSDREYTGVVQWNNQQCGFVIQCGKYVMEIVSLAMSGDGITTNLDSFEVIGNIYENPESLKP